MQPPQRFDGIEGLQGREPVGAALTIGVKGPSGAPTETDRFHFVSPHEGADSRRPLLPTFARFNGAEPKHRQSISGNMVHADIADAFEYHLRAQQLGGEWPNHPQGRPACQGDGERAVRLYAIGKDGASDDFREIPCPNELCEFRQGNVKKCKPFGRLYFRPRWNVQWGEGGLPTPLVKWTTGSWNSVANLKGFFDHVRHQAEQLGLAEWSVYGLPLTLTLGRKTKPQEKRAFPVVSITPDVDLIDFFLAQRKRLAEAGGRLLLAVGARDTEEQERADADAASIIPGIPGEVLDVQTEVVEAEPPAADPYSDAGEGFAADDDPSLPLGVDAATAHNGVTLLPETQQRNLRTMADSAKLDADAIAAEITGGGLAHSPADSYAAISRAIAAKARAAAKHSKGRK